MIPGMHTALVNDFHLETKYAEELRSYYVLHWELGHLLRIIQRNKDNTVLHNGITYIPIFQFHPTWDDRTTLRMSFRETLFDKDPNYVLIKKLGS